MQIIHHDKDLVIIVKPVGLDAEHDIPSKIKEVLGGEVFTLHRLDLNVGGVMVYARNKQTAATLSRTIENHEMIKEYFAMVHGTPDESGILEDLLFKDSHKNKVFVVKRERKGVKKAKLEYQRLTSGETSLVHIRLHTGRSHQIRVQFASRNFPLVGDHKYGSKDNVKLPMLYSCKITFPFKGQTLTFEAYPEWYNVM